VSQSARPKGDAQGQVIVRATQTRPGSHARPQTQTALYALFGTGYLGYTAARQWGKVKGVD